MAISLSNLPIQTVTEGGSLQFQFAKEASDPASFKIRWVIVPKGILPISSSDFTSLSGEQSFTSADTEYLIDLSTVDNDRGGPNRNYEIQFYLVDETDPTGASDTLIDTFDGTIAENDETDDSPFNLPVDGNLNALAIGFGYDTPVLGGAGGDDHIIITQYQYANATINDSSGVNTISFDYGVAITDVTEVTEDNSGYGFTIEELIMFGVLPPGATSFITIRSVTFTLSTGATIFIDTPTASFYRFQLGDGEVKGYSDFRTDLMVDDPDNPGTKILPTAATPKIVDGVNSLPDLSGNSPITDTKNLTVSGADDIMLLGGEFGIPSAGGAGGDDYIVVSRYLSANVTINDSSGVNTISFDYGVAITDVTEVTEDNSGYGFTIEELIMFGVLPPGATSFITIRSVTFTLSTGATIFIDTPTASFYRFQLGGDEVKEYSDFRTDLMVDDPDNPGTKILPTADTPFTVPIPGAPPAPPPPAANTAPTVDTPLAVNFGTDENAVFTAADFGFSDNDGGLNGRFATLKITALPTANGVLEYDDSGTWKTIILTGTAGTGEFLLTDGEIAVADLAKLRLNPADSYMGDVTFTYRVIDGGGEASATDTTATVTFATPAAVTSGDTGTALPENTEVATDTAVYTATSEGFSGAVSWSLSGADADLFDIDASTGVVTFKTATTPDYETKSSYSFTVTATLGAVTAEQAVTIAVTDVNEDDSLPVVEAGYYAYDSTANEFRKYDADGNVETGVAFERVNLNTTNNTIRLDSNLPAGDAERVSLLGGDDIYEIYGDLVRDITISETEGTDNLVRFMDGVRIISVETESPPGGGAEKLVIKLGTATPSATETATIELLGGVGRYNFQFGNGQVIDLVDELADLPVGVQLDIP